MMKAKISYMKKLKLLKSYQDNDILKFDFKRNEIKLRLIDQSNETIRFSLKWRTKFWDYFDTKFKGNPQRTEKWIEDILKNPKRILFLIYCNENKIGHIGFDHYDNKKKSVIIQNVILAERKKYPPGTMKKILEKMIRWMFMEFNFRTIQLKVFSDNYKAINVYEKCGFLTVGNEALMRKFTKDGWKWIKNDLRSRSYPERWFNIMEISRNDVV